MYLIIGLGNPGDKYKNTKHNVGFWTVDKIADKINATAEKKQCDAIVRQGIYGGKKVLLVKPQTYMNLSGHAVQQLLNYYKDRVEDILVIHDTGAHGFSMGYNYNGKLKSAEVLLCEDGSTKLIRRAETASDYFATFDCFEIGKKLQK